MYLDTLKPTQQETFPLLKSFPDFYLAGGTALALQIGHRISDDFDLFSSQALPTSLLKKIEAVFSQSIIPIVNTTDELSVTVRGVNISFIYYPFSPLLPLTDLGGSSALSVPEIAATKAYTIGRRRELKDYVDLFTVFSRHLAKVEDTITLAKQKFGEAFSARLFLEQLLDFQNIPKDKPIDYIGKHSNHEEIQQFLEGLVKQIKL